jgi:hypothetical protein
MTVQITDICIKKTKKFNHLKSNPLTLKQPKKLLLELDSDYDFKLMGIVTTAEVYRLGWLLHHKLRLFVERLDDIEIHLLKKKESAYFPLFEFQDEEQRLEYFMLGNRSEGNFLIPEMKQVSYWLLIRGVFDNLNESQLLKKVKALPQVQTALWVNPEELKSKDNLML